MKEAIIMTKEEYQAIQSRLQEADDIITALNVNLSWAFDRINALWNTINRPAIEAAAKAHDDEFYAWCYEMADKYEEQDEAEWIAEMSTKYNSGAYECAQRHNCSIEDLQWKIWAEHYVSADQLPKAHGWPTKESTLYRMFANIADSYKRGLALPNFGTHERKLYMLMMYFACYHLKGTHLDRFWADSIAVEYGIDHI